MRKPQRDSAVFGYRCQDFEREIQPLAEQTLDRGEPILVAAITVLQLGLDLPAIVIDAASAIEAVVAQIAPQHLQYRILGMR